MFNKNTPSQYCLLAADTLTPVSIYLKLRDQFANSIILESSEYQSKEGHYSYICCDPVAHFKVEKSQLEIQYPGLPIEKTEIKNSDMSTRLSLFLKYFEKTKGSSELLSNAAFGYMNFEAFRYADTLELKQIKPSNKNIPDVFYQVFRYVLVFNHFTNELHLHKHFYEDNAPDSSPELKDIIAYIHGPEKNIYPFKAGMEITSSHSNETFEKLVKKGIDHCHRGDVFQIVLSRSFKRNYQGDDFNIYRSLRRINPSPYLFYFDFGNFKLLGSSPEAQIKVVDNEAIIYPIAGTCKRGEKAEDKNLESQLKLDPKEKSEHMMLVDLARNDLNRVSKKVQISSLFEAQYFSHVIHMVSKVKGAQLTKNVVDVNLKTFPAGTLSGAPKYRAIDLIHQLEKEPRSFYGGCIGFYTFQGESNHAIMIRTALCKGNQITIQAGAGVVSMSQPTNELEEVNNKLAAMNSAIEKAETT